jgi:hypothetical protein
MEDGWLQILNAFPREVEDDKHGHSQWLLDVIEVRFLSESSLHRLLSILRPFFLQSTASKQLPTFSSLSSLLRACFFPICKSKSAGPLKIACHQPFTLLGRKTNALDFGNGVLQIAGCSNSARHHL